MLGKSLENCQASQPGDDCHLGDRGEKWVVMRCSLEVNFIELGDELLWAD